MTNYVGMTKSNYVELESERAFNDLIDYALGHNLAHFRTYSNEDEQVAIGSDAAPMHIEEPYIDEFLTELGHAITEPMVIRSVGYEAMRHVPDAWQWVVLPDGEWHHESLADAHEVEGQYRVLKEESDDGPE